MAELKLTYTNDKGREFSARATTDVDDGELVVDNLLPYVASTLRDQLVGRVFIFAGRMREAILWARQNGAPQRHIVLDARGIEGRRFCPNDRLVLLPGASVELANAVEFNRLYCGDAPELEVVPA